MRLKHKLYIVLASMGRIKTQQYETTDEDLLAAVDQMHAEIISARSTEVPPSISSPQGTIQTPVRS